MTRRAPCLSLLFASLLMTGCASLDLLSCSPAAAGAPAQGPECSGTEEQIDRDPLTVERVLGFADWIVVADVVGIQDSVWNTPGGQPPDGGTRPGSIVTPVDIVVRHVVVGAGPQGDLRVVLDGGTVGNTVHGSDPAPPVLLPGKRYALIMVPSVDSTGVPHPELPLVVEAWPIDANGDIVTTYDGTLSIDELAGMAGG